METTYWSEDLKPWEEMSEAERAEWATYSVEVICRHCFRHLGGQIATTHVQWGECSPECPDDRTMWDKFVDFMWKPR